MNKPIQDAYIVAAARLPIGKRNGYYKTTRPDDMLVHAIRTVLGQAPALDPALIDDIVAGCALPEAEQGLNVARMAAMVAGGHGGRFAAQRSRRAGEPVLLVGSASGRHGSRPHSPR